MPKKRPSSMRTTLNALFYKARTCSYCERQTTFPSMLPGKRTGLTASIDHKVPISRGGDIRGNNIVLACTACNNLKSDMMPDEWTAYMAANPEWWTFRNSFGSNKPKDILARAIAREQQRAAARRVIPKSVPIVYPDDSNAQAAFEHVFRNRLYMLRVEASETNLAAPLNA